MTRNAQDIIDDMRNIVKPRIAKMLLEANFEGCGKEDKAEFETEFEMILTLAEKALKQEPFFWEKCPYYEPDMMFDGKDEYDMGQCKYKQEPKTDTWSIKDVADTLAKHGLIEYRQKMFSYLDGVADGLNESNRDTIDVLDSIMAEIKQYQADCDLSCSDDGNCKTCNNITFGSIYRIIDKYKTESEGSRESN